jgi:uncharacterized membrane protein YhaH (DUF805 family)
VNNILYDLLLKGWFRRKGRSSRQEYILRILFFLILAFIQPFLSKFFIYCDNILISLLFGAITIFFLGPITILSLIQVFFVTHRRLHDLNASGWWQLITFIPLGQILMIGFIFFKGTQGPNKYGKEPKY